MSRTHSTTGRLARHRRRALRAVAIATGALLTTVALSSCAPPADGGGGGGGGGKAATIVRLGTPGGTNEVLDPIGSGQGPAAAIRQFNTFDGLTEVDASGKIVWGLATAMTPNADHTVWTVKLRKGVTFHDGSPFGADDVIATIKHILDPKNPNVRASSLKVVDPDGLKKIDDHTLQIAMTERYGPMKALWEGVPMLKKDYDPKHPQGTGPFEVTSFTAGQQTTMKAFKDYWGGAPKIKKAQIVDFKGNDAVVNALKGGQVDIAYVVPLAQVKQLSSIDGIKILKSPPNRTLSMTMDVKKAPFDNVKVRQALRLLVNRKQMVSNAIAGFGSPANDYETGYGACTPPDLPQRTQDIPKAKKLLAEAGESDLHISIATAGDQVGMSEMVQLFARQAKQAGVTVDVNKLDLGGFLDKWGKWPMYTDFTEGGYLEGANGWLPGSGNASNWLDPEFQGLVKKLLVTTGTDEQCDIMNKMRAIEYERGPSIIPFQMNSISAYRSTVHGLKPDATGKAAWRLDDVTVTK